MYAHTQTHVYIHTHALDCPRTLKLCVRERGCVCVCVCVDVVCACVLIHVRTHTNKCVNPHTRSWGLTYTQIMQCVAVCYSVLQCVQSTNTLLGAHEHSNHVCVCQRLCVCVLVCMCVYVYQFVCAHKRRHV